MSEGREGPGPGERSGVDGKRVLVTGGSRGLGEQIVRLLAAGGARLATCARTPEHLRSLTASLSAEGYGEPFTRALDVTEPELLERFVDAAAERFSGLDGVVACAGGARGRGIEDAGPQDWSLTWEMNVGHTARLVKAAVPHLRRAGGGSVVVIASISGWKPGPQAQYGAAKAAQIHLAASLARELGPDGIRVNAVSPGSMLIPGSGGTGCAPKSPRRTPGSRPSCRAVNWSPRGRSPRSWRSCSRTPRAGSPVRICPWTEPRTPPRREAIERLCHIPGRACGVWHAPPATAGRCPLIRPGI
ncbi:hypothetical protein SVIO_092430 [Streptomyces violaceusniger]|uniref:Ketoreductase domain-containing protein n=1 Tax=Streptomyces violaceusniger TaxID=68280 RepID=A0A4D4LHJ2_STRVO|nr:hypothetical protein SVIO_092430 [Streptomyces violaceusniger]